ncbi:unnamed protein product [Caenorhabditis brenneri]
MAYVESFYLEPVDQAPVSPGDVETKILHEENDVVIPQSKNQPISDYCGFESEEIPPVYRAQLRAAQKTKILAAENAEKSVYAYGCPEEIETKPNTVSQNKTKEENEMASNDTMLAYYVPGFSPPPQNDHMEIQKRHDFTLPKIQAIEATEHVFKVSGKNESSQYIPMENEDQVELNRYNKSQTESLISYTASDVTSMINTSSCHTATLGPAYGYTSSAPVFTADKKYEGLNAFRPVTKSLASYYAMPDLN